MKKLMEKIKSIDYVDILKRALKTFIQGLLASLAFYDITDVKTVLIGALSGGISAVMNFIVGLFKEDEE